MWLVVAVLHICVYDIIYWVVWLDERFTFLQIEAE